MSHSSGLKSESDASEPSKVRLDKFLWAARFYKTRALASEAINGGKVTVNDQRMKPSKEVHAGDVISLRQGNDQRVVVVQAVSGQRGSASVAQQLYTETPDSIARREAAQLLRKQIGAMSVPGPRPTKRARRQIIRFRESGG